MYLIILAIALLVSLVFATIITNSGSNYKLSGSFLYYFLICLFCSPLVAIGFALLDALTKSPTKEKQTTQENKPTPSQGGKLWIADDNDKRIEIYQSELDFYVGQGWHLLDEQQTPPPTHTHNQ